jgi:enoyl-CoA hydratase/carnithine racemase
MNPDPGGQLIKIHLIRNIDITANFFRPEKRNCVNSETAEKLKLAFQEFESDEDMYCCVLYGLGRD